MKQIIDRRSNSLSQTMTFIKQHIYYKNLKFLSQKQYLYTYTISYSQHLIYPI